MLPGGIFDPERLKQRIELLEHKASGPDFWNDQKKAQATMQELDMVRQQSAQVERWERAVEDIAIALELGDPTLEAEMELTLHASIKELDAWETTQLLSGQYDSSAAILSVSAGAGGTDAADWALMHGKQELGRGVAVRASELPDGVDHGPVADRHSVRVGLDLSKPESGVIDEPVTAWAARGRRT